MISKQQIKQLEDWIITSEKFIRCTKCNNIGSCCFSSDKLYCEACDIEYGLQTRLGEWQGLRKVLRYLTINTNQEVGK